ncbi:MAG TPA: hypothetical protein VGN23_09470 [Verrucomicrobiae bacterium]|jgi:hypothetical protein
MRKSSLIVGAALTAIFIIGCFNLLGQQSASIKARKNLGVVVFTNGMPRYFSLGDAKSCTATAKHVALGTEVDFLIQATNSDGTVYPVAAPTLIITIPNQYGEVASDGVSIKLKPILKAP